MGAGKEPESSAGSGGTTVQRKSERELVITRRFDAPARIVFQAWTTPGLLQRWWVPKSSGASLLSCEADVRAGGRYRFEIGRPGSKPMVFFGQYLEVVPNARLVWTNEESDEGAVTTLTFEEADGKTLLVLHELYPSKEALDRTMAGMDDGMSESFSQLDGFLPTLASGAGSA